jgi:hypothetical protein
MGFLVLCGPLDVAKPLQIRSDIPATTTKFPLLGELHTTIQAWKNFVFLGQNFALEIL